jgi:hypothetical protein
MAWDPTTCINEDCEDIRHHQSNSKLHHHQTNSISIIWAPPHQTGSMSIIDKHVTIARVTIKKATHNVVVINTIIKLVGINDKL